MRDMNEPIRDVFCKTLNNPMEVDPAGGGDAAAVLWDPSDYANTKGWWDAFDNDRKTGLDQSTSYITLNGADVLQWVDRIAGYTIDQAVEADQPLRGAGYVEFQSEDLQGTDLPLVAQPNMIFVAFKQMNTGCGNWFFDSAVEPNRQAGGRSAPCAYNYYAGGTTRVGPTVIPSNVNRLMSYKYNGANSIMWVNGIIQEDGTNPGSEGLDGLTIGGNYLGTQATGPFRVQEFIVVSGDLSLADRELFEGYLAHKMNQENSDSEVIDDFDAGHTYKSTAPMV